MPLYEYECSACGHRQDCCRKVDERHDRPRCTKCRVEMDLMISRPAVVTWKSDRQFPNLKEGARDSATFETKKDYDAFLAKKGFAEVGVEARKKRKSMANVTFIPGPTGARVPPGAW